MEHFDGIYTAYMTGSAGEGMAMFVFLEGRIAGADVAGLSFSGNYQMKEGRMVGQISYRMPAGTSSITGVSFDTLSEKVDVPIDLPATIDPNQTYRINTPIGPLNAKFVKNVDLGARNAD